MTGAFGVRIVLFYHSLISDWNNPVVHFIRGVASELLHRGHDVTIFEQHNNWSLRNLRARHGDETIIAFRRAFPQLAQRIILYDPYTLDLDRLLINSDLVIVQDWINPLLAERIGKHRSTRETYRALFHDTRHRIMTDPEQFALCDVSDYDGVLASANVVRDRYRSKRCARDVWTWHPAADTRLCDFSAERQHRHILKDFLSVSNWQSSNGQHRADELERLLVRPSRRAHRTVKTYGARYPQSVRDTLAHADIDHGGWLANDHLPRALSRYRAAVHLPRDETVHTLPGVVSPFVFEALACGCPLLSTTWQDPDGLFTADRDYLSCDGGEAIQEAFESLMAKPEAADELAQHGRATIMQHHTCAHRVDELLAIVNELNTANHHAAANATETKGVGHEAFE